MVVIALIAQLAVLPLLFWIAWRDVLLLRIRNNAVLILLALYIPAQGGLGFPTIGSDLFAGAVLFGLGFVLWMLRALGAGDSKLMLPLGMHLGFAGLLPFAVLLLLISVLFYVAITVAFWMRLERGPCGWLASLKRTGRVPYGLPLCGAALPVLFVRFLMLAVAQ